MSRERFPCGCVADARAWRELCPAHRAEHDAYHAAETARRQAARDIESSNIAAHTGVAVNQEG